VIVRIYGDFNGSGQFWAAKNKPNSKPILLSPPDFPGIEKSKPICLRANWRYVINNKGMGKRKKSLTASNSLTG